MAGEILVEVFLPPGICHCSTKTMRAQLERIAEEVERSYGREVKLYYYPVNAPRASEIGVFKANSIAINGEVALEGYFLAQDVKREIIKRL